MAFSTNLRGLRSVAMAVLVSGSLVDVEQVNATETIYKPLEKGTSGAGNRNLVKKK